MSDLTLDRIMSRPAVTISIDANLAEAEEDVLELMLRHDVKHVPIVGDDGRASGMVARHDLLKLLADQLGGAL